MTKAALQQPSWESDGVVMRAYPYADSDLVLRILSKELGKISALAKGSRSNRRKNHYSFDVFDRGRFQLHQGRGSLLLIHSFTPGPAFRSVRTDLDKLSLSSLICEAFDLLIKEGAGDNESVFNTLNLSLEAVEEAKDLREALKASYFSLSNLLC